MRQTCNKPSTGLKLTIPGLIEQEENLVDLLCRDSEGDLVTVEMAGHEDHEAHNALFCFKAGPRRHVSVCTTQDMKDKVTARLNEQDELVGNRVIKVLTLASALKKEWIP